uniref:Uncharacterized protein n=1 Tax=Arundo donax TaxID=35708 RepID=A0A0A8ZB88_ARUDO
MPKFKTLVQKI